MTTERPAPSAAGGAPPTIAMAETSRGTTPDTMARPRVPDSASTASRIVRPDLGGFIALSIGCLAARISTFSRIYGGLPQNSRSGGVHCNTLRTPSMVSAERFVFASFLTFVLAGATVRAEDAVHPAR